MPHQVLIMPKASRAFLVGSTGTGKSTVGEVLMAEYQQAYSTVRKKVRVLIVDTKPRFRALMELNGFTTKDSGRYKKWGMGSEYIPSSYVLARKQSIKTELDRVWSLHGTVAIAQVESEHEWAYCSDVARHFFEDYGASIPRLVFVDELADFYKYRALSDIFQRIARNGRERNIALIAASQRPRKVPTEIMTEMQRLYMFNIDYKEDLKHVYEFGIPKDVAQPQGHAFYLYDRTLKLDWPSNFYHELQLPTNSFWDGSKRGA